MLESVLTHLQDLVSFDTQNPPRALATADGIVEYLCRKLASFKVEIHDVGDGCIIVHAVRGKPERLYNFHVDTVPAAPGYTANPFILRVDETLGRAIGLGACDIKGASACMLAAIEATQPDDVALLFTTDEEAGSSRCVRTFCEQEHDYTEVVVAEPTLGRAVLEHRGIVTATAKFAGIPGHASNPRALADSAVHRAIEWSAAALEFARERESQTYASLSGMRFNIGRVEGGVKPNMIAGDATVRFGFRPLPREDGMAVLDEIWSGVDDVHTLTPGFVAPSLPHPEREPATAVARTLGVEVGDPVDFWTEAALFSQAGFDALVYGPGDIAQAHTADEWVSLASLEEVARTYTRWLADG